MMFSERQCREQAAESVRLRDFARNTDEARLLGNISVSLTRLAGQIDRYNALVRDQFGRRNGNLSMNYPRK